MLRFHEPPGDNVKEITDEGLRRWPNHRRLLDVRVRAAYGYAELDREWLAQNFPRQDDGRLPLDEEVLLVEIRGSIKSGEPSITGACAS